MSNTQIIISSNARAIIGAFKRMPSEFRVAIKSTLNNQNARTLRDLTFGRMGYPSNGPVVPDGLRRISSTAVRSLRATPAVDDGNGVVSSLGTNLVYVKAHEWGFQGVVFVRAHNRRIMEYGKARLVRFINPLDKQEEFTWRRKRRIAKDENGNDKGTTVRAHSMKMNLPARHMIRDTLADRVPEYSAAISDAIVVTWRKSMNNPANRSMENFDGGGI